MTGMTDYTSKNLLNWVTGQVAEPSLPAVYLGLFTAVGTDNASGFTEVAGNNYARVQVAGSVATNGSTSTSSAVLNFASVPAWVVPGMTAKDASNVNAITGGQTVLSVTTTTVTLSGNVNATVSSADTIVFSAFGAPTGSAPSQTVNTASITFPQAQGAGWGTVIAFGLFDAASSGNMLLWDFVGNFPWFPASVSAVGSGNGAVFTTHAHGLSNADPVVATAEYGGTMPTVTQETLAAYAVNYVDNVTTDTFTLNNVSTGMSSANAVWTSTTGDIMVRKITQQQIPANVTATFAASSFVVGGA